MFFDTKGVDLDAGAAAIFREHPHFSKQIAARVFGARRALVDGGCVPNHDAPADLTALHRVAFLREGAPSR
ncbi:MAG TPA: hypothetical protein VFG30_27660 [Polyangiales bacterium]|nr:hypothetical protein [Polyangiales bacterium]